MILLALLVVLVTVGLPLAYSWRVWRLDRGSRASWLALTAESTLIVLLVMIAGRWDIAGYFFRYALAALFAVAVVLSSLRHRHRPWRAAGEASLWRGHKPTLLSLALLFTASLYVGAGMVPPQDTHDLAFPLRGGWFAIAQGGGNKVLNHHSGHPQQNYAADITALNTGMRAR